MLIAIVPHDHAGRGASWCTEITVGIGRFGAQNDSLKAAVCRLYCMLWNGCGRSRSGPKRNQYSLEIYRVRKNPASSCHGPQAVGMESC